MIKKLFGKRYSDEIHIFDGIILTVFLAVFLMFNYNTMMQIKGLDLFFICLLLCTTLLLTILTIKNVIIHRDEIQISVAFFVALGLTLFNNFYFVGVFAYWMLFMYYCLFVYVFFRNFILKVYNKKSVTW